MILLALLLQLVPVRTYWPVTVAQLASGTVKHTHIAVRGRVAYSKIELDGDIHVKLRSLTPGDTSWVIAECVPKLPCRRPAVGEIVTVKGISRRDAEHLWWEIHIVEELSP
jgi:hypothetical protein